MDAKCCGLSSLVLVAFIICFFPSFFLLNDTESLCHGAVTSLQGLHLLKTRPSLSTCRRRLLFPEDVFIVAKVTWRETYLNHARGVARRCGPVAPPQLSLVF